jgi:hypothetical protein
MINSHSSSGYAQRDSNGGPRAASTLAEVWDGTTWAVQSTPNQSGAPGSALVGVSCTSATSCEAVGFYDNSFASRVTLAEVWNGTTWAVQSTPIPTDVTFSALGGVSCPSATSCEAVGAYSVDFLNRYVTLVEEYS